MAQQIVAVFRTQKIYKVVFHLNPRTDVLQVNLVCDNGAADLPSLWLQGLWRRSLWF